MTRREARQAILVAANGSRLSTTPYRMKNLQQAVHRVRERQLVHTDVLRAAGFKEHRT